MGIINDIIQRKLILEEDGYKPKVLIISHQGLIQVQEEFEKANQSVFSAEYLFGNLDRLEFCGLKVQLQYCDDDKVEWMIGV